MRRCASAAMAGHVHHLEEIGAVLERARDEAGAQRMSGKQSRVNSGRAAPALDDQRDRLRVERFA
jgi:hypothetical protein